MSDGRVDRPGLDVLPDEFRGPLAADPPDRLAAAGQHRVGAGDGMHARWYRRASVSYGPHIATRAPRPAA